MNRRICDCLQMQIINEINKYMKPKTLFEVGDNYIQAVWRRDSGSMDVIAIFRDQTVNEREDFALHSLNGPWSVVKDGKIVRDKDAHAEYFEKASALSVDMLNRLNRQGMQAVKDEWEQHGGIVYAP